ncbi:sir2 family histone deacetylase hst4 [Moniliophthora roreri]|nr:sir2 family histone deacetylase hst4 [Moniliophthora roreri]
MPPKDIHLGTGCEQAPGGDQTSIVGELFDHIRTRLSREKSVLLHFRRVVGECGKLSVCGRIEFSENVRVGIVPSRLQYPIGSTSEKCRALVNRLAMTSPFTIMQPWISRRGRAAFDGC